MALSTSPRPEGHRPPTPTRRRGPLRSGLVPLRGGTFLMGTDDRAGFADDGEGPVREVSVSPFAICAATVTNASFAAFVKETGYVTDAERFGWSYVFEMLAGPEACSAAFATMAGASWWVAVHGADWRHPDGPGSEIGSRSSHPVVHVSWHDASAYCDWAGGRLPGEAEWEFAARGGLVQARYPWGDELVPGGVHRANIWQGVFPRRNTAEDGYVGTAPVRTYRPNGYGLYQMAGNVWEWCADPWSATGSAGDASADDGDRVLRGGSYLCHASYCNRYRVAARTSAAADSSSGNTGFRMASSARPGRQGRP